MDELIQHALNSLRGCLQGDQVMFAEIGWQLNLIDTQEMTASNISIAVVSKSKEFTIIEGSKLQPYVGIAY